MSDGRQPFFLYLDSIGDGTGTKDMATTPDVYLLECATDKRLIIERMLISYQDAGGGTVEEYGNLGAALTTGIEVKLVDENDNVLIDLTDGVPVQQNGHWSRQCFDAARLDWGAGEDLFIVRWTFSKAGRPIFMERGDRFEFQINDSLVNLSNHYVNVQGYYLK